MFEAILMGAIGLLSVVLVFGWIFLIIEILHNKLD